MTKIFLKGVCDGEYGLKTFPLGEFNAGVTLKSDGGLILTISSKRLSNMLDMSLPQILEIIEREKKKEEK